MTHCVGRDTAPPTQWGAAPPRPSPAVPLADRYHSTSILMYECWTSSENALDSRDAGGIGHAVAEQLTDKRCPCCGHRPGNTELTDGRSGADGALRRRPASVIARMVDLIEHELGGIDILVNSADTMRRSDILAIEPEHWDSSLGVDLKSIFFCTQAVAQSTVRRDRPGAGSTSRRSTTRSCSRTAWRTAPAGATSGR